ncbi:hypothetical protein OYC64_001041 [Pagothenia borchgrevinki]|uniref:Deoxynucleoside triphosphate triphosphohydrolase SAMHD1 n=1 Tax=Pagothenia borchgrevinki TaxID=8213 RepID=A0ABD2HGI5_PAGBO
MASEDYGEMNGEDMCEYLKEKGLEGADTFKEKPVIKLSELDDDFLTKMGIDQPEDRQNILDSILRIWPAALKVFNDPIHGHMELHPLLVKIIDTPQFQRLRYIKQLGAGYFVYPGASHNRFEHSIGVGYLAGELVKALKEKQQDLNINKRDILCVQIAGLCHDLGHGPFSHMFDQMLILKATNQDPPCPLGEKMKTWKHEDASVKMFNLLVESTEDLKGMMRAYGLKEPEDLDFIKEMIKPPEAKDKSSPQYKCHPEKSFLYEIVANERNGIDVDKFDYFARDSYHLGIKNNFDHGRFIKFARVCEVDGQKHICTRDKEVNNLYDLFNTRHSLHRRAYQHNVVKIIEHMIAEAFLKADEHIEIKGSGGEMFTLSTAITDMEAYTKLTDCVFYEILNSTEKDGEDHLREAREILTNIVKRKHYTCLGEIKPEGIPSKEEISQLRKDLTAALPLPREGAQADGLTKEDFVVLPVTLDYGEKGKDPIDSMHFYNKNSPTKAFKIKREVASSFRQEDLSEMIIMVYSKRIDPKSLRDARKQLEQWIEGRNDKLQDAVWKNCLVTVF